MARGRFISESVAKDMRLNSLSVEAELVYLMTIPHLDRDGLIEGDTDVLYGTVCPKRRIFMDRMGEFIQEWLQVGLVTMYDSSEGQVLWFRGFAKNQLGLRYDRETPSKFPPPPGHKFAKDGIIADDTPTDDNSVRQNDGGVRQMSAQVQVEVKDQVQAEGEGDRVRAQEPSPPPPPIPPPPALHYDTLPGVPIPKWRQVKRDCDTFMGQAQQLNIGPEPFRRMFDMVLEATGKLALAEADPTESYLNEAKQTAITLAKMGFATIEDVQAVLLSWRENDWRGASAPTCKQIVEHASAMLAGTHVTARKQDSSKKDFASFADYNEWAARHDPQYKRIREGVVIKGIRVQRASYQPGLAH